MSRDADTGCPAISDFARAHARENGEPVFAEPWQAQAFALAVSLHQRGLFTWSEWATTLADVISKAPERAYYESWLIAIEQISARKSLVASGEYDERQKAWAAAEAATPHGEPILLERIAKGEGKIHP